MKGTLSTITATLISLLVLTTLLASFISTYDEALRNYKTVTYSAMQDVSEYGRRLEAFITGGGLVISSPTPPAQVLGILILYENGSLKKLRGPFDITDPVTVVDSEALSHIAKSGGKILVLGSGGYYILVDPVKPPYMNGGGEDYFLDLSPYLISGKLLNGTSFLKDPVPGTSSDTGANFQPDIYVRLGKYSTGVLNDELKVDYVGSPGTDHHELLFYNRSQALILLLPLHINPGARGSRAYLIHVKAVPLDTPSSNIDVFHLYVAFKPVVFAVAPYDYARTYLITKPGKVMYLGQYQNSVARALYSSEGSTLSAELSSYTYTYDSKTYTHQDLLDTSIIVKVNLSEVSSSLPSTLEDAVVLAGIEGYISYGWEHGGTALTDPYAEVSIGIYNVSTPSYTVEVPISLTGIPILVNDPFPNTSLRVEDPEGNEVQLYGAGNVESSTYTHILWFKPVRAGNYTMKLLLNKSNNIDVVNLTVPACSEGGIGLTSEHNVERTYLLSSESSSGYLIDSDAGYAYCRSSLTHSFLGYTYWWSSENYDGVRVTYSGIPPNTLYYIEVSESSRCSASDFGWYAVTKNLHSYAAINSGNACTYSLLVGTSYSSGSNSFTLYSRPTIYGSWRPLYDIRLLINSTEKLSLSGSNGFLVYSYNGSPYLALLDLGFIIPNIFQDGQISGS